MLLTSTQVALVCSGSRIRKDLSQFYQLLWENKRDYRQLWPKQASFSCFFAGKPLFSCFFKYCSWSWTLFIGSFLCSFQYLSMLQYFDEQFVISIQLALLIRVIRRMCTWLCIYSWLSIDLNMQSDIFYDYNLWTVFILLSVCGTLDKLHSFFT